MEDGEDCQEAPSSSHQALFGMTADSPAAVPQVAKPGKRTRISKQKHAKPSKSQNENERPYKSHRSPKSQRTRLNNMAKRHISTPSHLKDYST